MTIQAKHFDVRLNRWIHIDNNEDNQESLLQEKISNTLLERFLPGKEFSFGHMDEKVTAKQLENHPEGHQLLLSSKTRLLYGSSECLDIIDQICPDRKDRGAYGSIFLGGCNSAIDTKLNVLVVDDSNGDNGGIINNDQAYKLTGDCYGQIADDVYRKLTGHEDGDKYRVIQHRFGWTPEDGNDDSFRFGKGTFRPVNLDETLQYTGESKPKIDVIIPISSFKGTDKDNPSGPVKPQIRPGLYRQKVWIGEKSQSELGKTAISQVLASFPKGIKDFTEKIELEAKKLAEAEKDPRKLAELYCEKYEKRKEYLENEANNLEDEVSQEFDEDKQHNIIKLRERLENDSFLYKVIKADLAGDCQLIETEKVKNELTKFVQGEWKDIAIGKKLQFERALVIPSKDLNDGEIYIPKYNDGEEVVNFRSPFLNSNGMCVSTNKKVEDAFGPDGKVLEGIIIVSDETSERIYKRLSKQIEEILPLAKTQEIKLEGIEEYLNREDYGKLELTNKIEFTNEFNQYVKALDEAGFDIKLLPYESEQERQARDYDGDCIGFEKASKYPNFTAEAKERNKPGNAYEPTVKLKKASFYDEQGNQPSFETIAKHMSDGISVGIINNHLTSVEALESEMEVIKEFGDTKIQASYIETVSSHYENLFKKENPEKENTLISDKYREYMNEVIEYTQEALDKDSDSRKEPLLKAMDANKTLYRELIADAAYQNQIAVDLFKSATTPDIDSVNQNSRLLHRNVNYIKDKKNSKVYDTQTINVTGYSPVELIIAKTNQYFRGSQLESRPLSQFQDFFKGVEYTNQQRMKAILAKKEFDTTFGAATRLYKRRETEKGPSMQLELANGKKLDVSNLLDANHPDIWDAKSIKVKVIPISADKVNSSRPHTFAVYAQVNEQVNNNGEPKFARLGNISKEQEFNFVKETGIKFGQILDVKSHVFQPALSEGQVKLLYNQAYEIAQNFYESIPDEEKKSMAAAAWAVSTTRESVPKDSETNEVQKEVEKAKKVSNFVFAAFENEIIERTNELQIEDTKVISFNKNSSIFQKDTEIRYNIDNQGQDIIEIKNDSGEYETFANLEAQASRLPIGTTATATAKYNEIYTATVTTQIPGKPQVTFGVGELIKYELGQQPFNGEQVQLEIQCIDRPQEDYIIYGGKDNKGKDIKIGRIDDNSVKEGVEQGWLQRAPGIGQNLQLKLTQIVSGKNGYAIGETPDGNMMRINLDKNFKESNIKDTNYRNVTMKAHGVSNVYMATIGGKTLGKIGVMPRTSRNIPQALKTLKDAGIIKNGQRVIKIPVTIESNQTTANISLNKETIKYPEQWVKRHQLLNSTENRFAPQRNAENRILSQINTRPTMLFQSKKQKQAGLVGLAVDENRAENTKLFLDRKGIEYTELSQTKIEARKGVVALVLNESSVSKDMMDVLLERSSGTVKNNDILEQNIPIFTEESVYFIDPNQEYDTDKKGVVGLVVKNDNADATKRWLEARGGEVNCIVNDNTTIILAKAESLDSNTIKKLNKTLGTPIDTSTVEGFDKYEADSQKLNEANINGVSTSKTIIRYNEYQTALRQLPNRPRNLVSEEEQLPLAPASPLEKSFAQILIERSRENDIASPLKINNHLGENTSFNEQQRKAYEKIAAFLQQPQSGNSKDNEFLLTGYAGTGKTYTLIKTLEENKGLKICFTAPTNAAVKVLRKMSKEQKLSIDSKTTHSLLGLKEKYNQTTGEVFYDVDKRKKRENFLNYDVIVVDEASMVNKQLREKLEEVAQRGVKVVYMGDPAQLPPVNEEESLIFQIPNCANLTEVMRYSGDIAKIAESIRNDIDNPNPVPIISSEDGQVVSLNKEQFKEEVIKLFNSDEFKQDNSSVKVLAYTNKQVDRINAFVKEELFGKDAPEYLEGMRLITRAPVVEKEAGEIKVILHNSDEITISSTTKIEENGYKVWELTGTTEENEKVTFKTIAEESKNKFNRDVKQLFAIEEKKSPQERDYDMVYAYKEQYADVRPAYAITVHNSQGKTIVKGAVDEENINTRLSMALKETDPEERARGIKEHQQLRYVAMTRFKEKVFVLGNQREINMGVEDKLAKARTALGNDDKKNIPSSQEPKKYEWARYAPKGREGYELSSAGDSRFSALNARLKDSRTIEEAYQLDVKGYRSQGNDWRLGKGKAPLTAMTKDEGYQKYKDLWKQWANENPQLIDELAQKAQGKVLTDKFASTSVSQARALAEILNERNIQNSQQTKQTSISLPSSREADKSKSLEIIGKINESKVEELRQHLETNYKPLMDADKSNYAPGRQVAWVNTKWELKEKDFSAGVKDDKLMELVKQIYPDADLALVTYSEQKGQGIDYHRDDSYAAAEARSINIGNSMWGYQAAKEGMVAWDPNANDNAPIQEFKLESGTVTRFNSKNPHAALETSAGRWSINIWSIKNDLSKSNSVREKFDKFQASNQPPTATVESGKDLTIKDSEWSPGGEIKVERSYLNRQEANIAGIIRMGNTTQARAATPNIPDNPQISGKPIPMTWELNQPPELKNVATTIDAMRGNGRVHSTRAQNYYQTYGIKEGDIAIARGKDNKQVAFRVGKQYKITQQMIDNPNYQKAWVNWEKHSVKELTENQAAKGKERQLYGLFMEPLGDYQNGQIIPFEQNQQQERTLNITFDGASRNNGKPDTQAAAAAVLLNPEGRIKEFSKYLGNKTNNEAEFQAAIVGMKAAQEFGYKSIKLQGDSQLVIEALQGKRSIKAENLKPLYEEAKSLLQSFDKAEVNYIPREQNKAADALANKALDNAAQNVNPIANLEAVTEAAAKHMVKDKAMAEVATQYIGISAAPANTPSSTRNYAQAWGDKANTGSYTDKDVIMVSGSGPWRGVTQNQIEETFQKQYVPLLDKAIAAYSDIVVGNAAGTDEIVKKYLQEKGYKLEQTPDNYARLSSQTKEISSPQVAKEIDTENLIINSSSTGLGAVLSNATDFAKKSGKLENDYQVSVNGNPEAPEGKYGLETHDFKPSGVPYNSAEHAYVHQSQINPDKDPYKVMVEVLQAKLEQHPRLANTITKKGGVKYLENAQIINEQDKQWEGKGKESKFIRALTEAYTNVIEKSSQNTKIVNPIAQDNTNETITPPQTTQTSKQLAVDVSENIKNSKGIAPGIVISSRSSSPLGAALTSTTVKSNQIGSIDKDYPVSFQDNVAVAKGSYGPETYTSDKPAGEPFASVEQAYYVYKESVENLGESRVNLLAQIQQARFEQHPELLEKVKENGGVEWLKECTYKVGSKNGFWEGKGEESPYIRSLIKGYEKAVQVNNENQSKASAPSAKKVGTPTQETPPPQSNKIQDKQNIPAFGTMDSIVECARNSTLEMLSNWQEIAQKLGKEEKYLNKINDAIEIYKSDGTGIENSFLAMAKDMKELEHINHVTRMIQRIANTVGRIDNNNVLSAKTTNGYQFSIASSDKNLLVYDKPENGSNILLYIKEGKIKVNKVNDKFVKDLKMMNFTIDNALSDVKGQLVV